MKLPTILAKRKKTMTCASCGHTVGADATECPECGSTEMRKSVVLIRKAVADKDEELDDDVLDDDDEDDVEDDDLEEEDFEPAGDEDDDDDEGKEVEQEPAVELKEEDKDVAKYEALNLTTALAEKITKAFDDPETARSVYETVMTEFNGVMDGAAKKWFNGKTVTKRAGLDQLKETVSKRLAEGIVAKTKVARPEALDNMELPDDVKEYIASLETGAVEDKEVEKKDEDIYKGLSPEVVERIQKADRLVEENEQRRWNEIAKSYRHFPGDKDELAKTLRGLSEKAPAEYEALKKTLDAAEHNLDQSDIFKSIGTTGAGSESTGSDVEIRKSKAKKLVDDGKFKTLAQAEAHLLDEHYAAVGRR